MEATTPVVENKEDRAAIIKKNRQDAAARARESRKAQKEQEKVEQTNVQIAQNIIDTSNLLPEEKAIFQRVMAEDESWKTITEGDVDDYSLAADPFELPAPAKKLRDSHEFAFRWITRSATRLDEVKNKPEIFRWWPVNRTSPRSGLFDQFIDPNNGCVSREDQMLVFKPYWLFEKEIDHKRSVADGMSNSKKLDDKNYEKGSASLVGSNVISKNRLKINGGDIEFRGEAEADSGQ